MIDLDRIAPQGNWFKVGAELWGAHADRLTEAGEPWDDEAVAMDLAWWLDGVACGRAPMPGRRTLSRRWCWSSKRTRVLLDKLRAHQADESGPEQGAHQGPHQGPREGHTKGHAANGSTEAISEKGPREGHTKGHAGATLGATGAPRESEGPKVCGASDTDNRQQTTDNTKAAPALPGTSPVEQVCAAWWAGWERRRITHPDGAPRAPELRKAERIAIEAALKGKHSITVDEAIMICRWVFFSDGDDAKFLRGDRDPKQPQNQYLSPTTVYRPSNVGANVMKAQVWWDQRQRHRAEIKRQTTVVQIHDEEPPPAPPPPKGTMRARLRAARADYV